MTEAVHEYLKIAASPPRGLGKMPFREALMQTGTHHIVVVLCRSRAEAAMAVYAAKTFFDGGNVEVVFSQARMQMRPERGGQILFRVDRGDPDALRGLQPRAWATFDPKEDAQ